jgi:hypothetical protein
MLRPNAKRMAWKLAIRPATAMSPRAFAFVTPSVSFRP